MSKLFNPFKAAITKREIQVGLWLALANAYSAEVCAGAGFDWLLIDYEHAPNNLPLIRDQLQAIHGSASHPVVRPPIGEPWIIKQLLDIGAQTILVPMVESGEQADMLAKAMRYPPVGTRGIGASLGRASSFNREPNYLQRADEQMCLLVQVESRAGIEALDDIALTDGVDGVFVGPADLAADMGYLGNPNAAPVVELIERTLERLSALGKPSGVLATDKDILRNYAAKSASFIAVGSDISLLATSTASLSERFKHEFS